jgi:hypothetical protein
MQPSAERGFTAEADYRSHHSHEDLLRRVCRFVRISEHPAAKRIDIGVRRAYQRIQCVGFAALASPHQSRLDVHPCSSTFRAEKKLRHRCNQASYSAVELVVSGAPCAAEEAVKMYAFVVFVGLALALAVVGEVLGEVLPVKFPRALSTTMTVIVAILASWAIDYSVFRAFGQPLRANWMNPVATGVVLVGAGEFLRALASSLGISISLGSRDRARTA